ncbi:MAG: FISUMP domain-containing protein [Bacteroidota bacterium]
MNNVSPNLFRTVIFSLACVLIGAVSCNKDDGPPPNPCSQTPLLTVSAETEEFSITANATGGEAPYTFQLDEGAFQSSGTFSGLSAKEYTVTVKDANDCIATTKITVIDPCAEGTLALEVKVDEFNIMATASGGTEPYTYSIDGEMFQESGVFEELEVGDYTVTVKDAKECTQITTITIVDCTTLAVQAMAEAYIITATASGGTEPYAYSIDGENFQESNVFADLEVGDYTITVKDSNECIASIELTNSCDTSGLEITVTAELYEINASGDGGQGPYTFSIDGENFQKSGVFADLSVQDYTVIIKDAKECTSTTQITAEQLESFTDPRDGQTYKVVTIGDQIWMAENLNYQGDGIGYSCPDNDAANCVTYGALYNWNEAQLVTPPGWHLPVDEDLEALIITLGGSDFAGEAMKVGGGSGFDALYSGLVSNMNMDYQEINYFGERATFWGEEINQPGARHYFVVSDIPTLILGTSSKTYYRRSIRCVKDE